MGRKHVYKNRANITMIKDNMTLNTGRGMGNADCKNEISSYVGCLTVNNNDRNRCHTQSIALTRCLDFRKSARNAVAARGMAHKALVSKVLKLANRRG
jgi:hypothetical protein